MPLIDQPQAPDLWYTDCCKTVFSPAEFVLGLLTLNTKGLARPVFSPIRTRFSDGRMSVEFVSLDILWAQVATWIYVGLLYR